MSRVTRLLDSDDEYLIARTTTAARELIQCWHGHQTTMTSGLKAAGTLFVHATNCWLCICKLLRGCANIAEAECFGNGTAAILRSLHDSCLQIEYVLRGDAKKQLTSDQLGTLYLNYEHVERFRWISRIDSFTSDLARHVSGSGKRCAAEPLIKATYERVEGDYPNKTQWHSQALVDIAKMLGREEEHFWFLATYNSSVHGGPMAALHGPTPSGADLYIVAKCLLIRAGKILCDAIGASLSDESTEVFESAPNILDRPGDQP